MADDENDYKVGPPSAAFAQPALPFANIALLPSYLRM
jgi:hypothetical protein